MKHLYTLVFAMLSVSFAFAQTPVREYAGRAITARPAQGQHVDYTRDIIYTNDFSDCSNMTFTNANDAGYEDYIDGINWECTTAAPSGHTPSLQSVQPRLTMALCWSIPTCSVPKRTTQRAG